MRHYLLMGTALGLGLPLNAAAQSAQPSDNAMPEIVVTASKRVERLADTPQTVNVVGGEQIAKLAVQQFSDVTKLVPGLQIDKGDGRQQAISMRGVTFDPDAATNSTVDVYMNEVTLSPSQALNAMFDIGSIQVLRGPQGTLRAGTGPSGAILIGTRLPNLNKVEVNGVGSFTDRNAGNVSLGVNFPIIPDVLAVRVAGMVDDNEGLRLRNVNTGATTYNRTWAGRVSVLFKPTNNFELRVMHQRLTSRTQDFAQVISTPGQTVAGPFGKLGYDDLAGVQLGNNRFYTAGNLTTINASWDFLGHRLSYDGSVQLNHFNTSRDLNLGGATTPAFLSFVIPGLGGQPYQEFQRIDTTQKVFSNEVRIERTGKNFWNYRYGVFIADTRSPYSGVIDYTGAAGACQTSPGSLALLGLPCLPLGVQPRSVARGYFTTQTFNFTDRDTLDVGVRYSTSKTLQPGNNSSFSAWTGSASFKHRFSESLLAYANAGTSYRPGGFDSTGASTASIPQSFFNFAAERSKSFEVGAKGKILDGRVFYALSAFYQKYDNFIARANSIACSGSLTGTGPTPGTVWNTNDGTAPNGANACSGTGDVNLTYNAPASARGIELELRGEVMRKWNAALTVTYADAHFDNALIPCNDYLGNGTPNNGTSPAVQAGKYVSTCRSSGNLSTAPKFQASFNTDANFDLGGNTTAFIRGLARFNGSATNANTGIHTPSNLNIDMFAGVRTPFGAEVSLFTRNLTNAVQRINQGPIYGLFGDRTAYDRVTVTKGREIGVQFKFDY